MNCANHPEVSAVAFCRECGKPMCRECERPASGSVFCAEHAPVSAAAAGPVPEPVSNAVGTPPGQASGFSGSGYAGSPYAESTYARPAAAPAPNPYVPGAAVVDPGVHPALALILGFCPGVGAIYNGQYAKGLIHAVIFGLLVSIESNSRNGGLQALIGILIAAFVMYMAFEAYHTARKRRYGAAVEEFSSVFETGASHGRFPMGAILLIGLGFVLLLDTTDIVSMEQFERYWPVLLILGGLYMLFVRLNPSGAADRNAGAPR